MKLFFYYVLHTFKNQLIKLFKSWVVVFILACALFGGIIGFIGGTIGSRIKDASEEGDPTAQIEEILEGEQENETAPAETPPEEAETQETDDFEFFGRRIEGLTKLSVVELAIFFVILLILVMETLSADNSGAKIFLPADVNLLFPSPMKPQRVLMFRLVTKMGLLVLLSLYMFIQMPNLTMNLGLPVPGAVSIIVAWGLLLLFSMLLQAYLYAFSASREGRKARISTTVYVILGVILLGFVASYLMNGRKIGPALSSYFNAPLTRFIPVVGWLKGFCMYMIEGNYLMGGVLLLLFLLASGALLLMISRMKADFYEDAMAKSEEIAELQREAKESGAMIVRKRKKDRSDSLMRDGLTRGEGANVFFWKTVYNRHRFAMLRYFTKTSITYTVISVGAALILFFVAKNLPFERFTIVALLMAAVAFYRSLGNPLDQDVRVDYFRMIPESSFKKLMYSLLGGSYNSLLDLLPGLLVSAILLQTPLYLVPAWILFILSVDSYSTTVATFIDLAVPQHTGKMIKQFVQIMFIYFGLGPVAALVVVGFLLEMLPLFLLIAGAMNVAFTALFLLFCAIRISPGRGK